MATFTGTSGADVFNPTPTADAITGNQGDDIVVYSRAGNTHIDLVLDFGTQYFTANMTGQQENPPVFSIATGLMTGSLGRSGAAFVFSAVVNNMDFGGQTGFTGDDLIAAHFHRGVIGVNGPVVFGFFGLPYNDLDADTEVVRSTGGIGGIAFGQWDSGEGNGTTLAALLGALRAGEIYINFHTNNFPGGEIRGQVLAVDQGLDRIDLRGANIPDFETLQQFLIEAAGSTDIVTRLNGQTHTLRLQDVPRAFLTAADFIFATATVNERLNGAAGADDLFGAGGDDELVGLAGDDRLFGGSGDDGLFGGDGADTAVGGVGNDRAFGGAAADLLLGGAGLDTLNGEAGDDLVFGGADNDVLSGEDGADILNGEAGSDVLVGGAGADILSGEADTDFLNGEGGADQLIGGAGADVFLYALATDSTAAATDLIADFQRGVDVIDLSRVDANSTSAGDQAFVFVSTFSNVAGQARLTFDSATNRTTFSGDVNGDGVADLVIVMVGQVGTGDGFIL